MRISVGYAEYDAAGTTERGEAGRLAPVRAQDANRANGRCPPNDTGPLPLGEWVKMPRLPNKLVHLNHDVF